MGFLRHQGADLVIEVWKHQTWNHQGHAESVSLLLILFHNRLIVLVSVVEVFQVVWVVVISFVEIVVPMGFFGVYRSSFCRFFILLFGALENMLLLLSFGDQKVLFKLCKVHVDFLNIVAVPSSRFFMILLITFFLRRRWRSNPSCSRDHSS